MNVKVFAKRKRLNDSLTDFLISSVNYDSDSKEIISLCVMQIYEKGGETFEIIKYDSAHGNCHVHRYYENPNDFSQLLPDNQINVKSFDEFKKDIKENWAEYKRRYFMKHFKQKL